MPVAVGVRALEREGVRVLERERLGVRVEECVEESLPVATDAAAPL